MPATLYLVATPIGNLEDISLRALRVLREEVEIIACEDTRQTLKLLDHFNIRKHLISYHEHNEETRTTELVARLESGVSVALVSDAGTPLVSDPGYRLVNAAIAKQIPVVPIPGASAVLSALAASGLPTARFRFIGFLSPKAGARRRTLEELRTEQATVIAYESPHRILESLQDIAELLPAHPVVIARELTKLHEEFLRGTADCIRAELLKRAAIKGEFTVLIGRAEQKEILEDPSAEIARLQADGMARMQAIKMVAKRLGLPKREVYRLAGAPGNSSQDKHRD